MEEGATRRAVRAAGWMCWVSVLLLAGCDGADEARDAERARLNAECATIRDELREELQAFQARALGAADTPALREAVERELDAPFRNPDPCFGHASLAHDVPGLFESELEAMFASLHASFGNAGEGERFIALQPARTQSQLLERIGEIRALASSYAATETD